MLENINLDVTEKGYYEVWVDDKKISQHSKPMKAVARASEEELKNPDSIVTVKQPDLIPVTSIKIGSSAEYEAQIKKLNEEIVMYLQEIERLKGNDDGGIVNPPVNQVLAFPSATGAGAITTGGRGGIVVHVTNLNDPFILVFNPTLNKDIKTVDRSSPDFTGSFREALEMTVPRTIVFDVSGIINLNTLLYLDHTNSNFTIAGQSAPEGGITVDGNRVYFSGVSNYIMRYIRFKGGIDADTIPNTDDNNGSGSFQQLNSLDRIMVDHCSFAFGKTMPGWSRTSDLGVLNNVTIQNCLFAETNKGALFGDDVDGNNYYESGDASFYNNVFYNSRYRYPNASANHNSNNSFDVMNNLGWNVQGRMMRCAGDMNLNHLNNAYYVRDFQLLNTGVNLWSENWTPSIYTSGNFIEANSTSNLTSSVSEMNADNTLMWKYFVGGNRYGEQLPSNFFTNTQFLIKGIAPTLLNGIDLRTTLPNSVGCNARLNADGSISNNLDVHDTEYLNNILNNVIVSPVAESAYNVTPIISNTRPVNFHVSNPHIPESYLVSRGITGNATIHNEIQNSGYSLIEEYLNQVDI